MWAGPAHLPAHVSLAFFGSYMDIVLRAFVHMLLLLFGILVPFSLELLPVPSLASKFDFSVTSFECPSLDLTQVALIPQRYSSLPLVCFFQTLVTSFLVDSSNSITRRKFQRA